MRDNATKRGSAKRRIAVLVAEDAPVIRRALRKMLDEFAEISVIGDSPLSDSVTQAARCHADVVLIHVVDPDEKHVKLTKTLRQLPNHPGVILMSEFKHPDVIRTFYAAGGGACLVTEISNAKLLAAIRRVAAGRRYIDPDISDEVVFAMVGDGGRPRATLSRRELEVLRLLASGHSYKETAQSMGISVASMETYRARIVEKLDLRSRAELIRYALLNGILQAGDESNVA